MKHKVKKFINTLIFYLEIDCIQMPDESVEIDLKIITHTHHQLIEKAKFWPASIGKKWFKEPIIYLRIIK